MKTIVSITKIRRFEILWCNLIGHEKSFMKHFERKTFEKISNFFKVFAYHANLLCPFSSQNRPNWTFLLPFSYNLSSRRLICIGSILKKTLSRLNYFKNVRILPGIYVKHIHSSAHHIQQISHPRPLPWLNHHRQWRGVDNWSFGDSVLSHNNIGGAWNNWYKHCECIWMIQWIWTYCIAEPWNSPSENRCHLFFENKTVASYL